jgi:hypothetical protein
MKNRVRLLSLPFLFAVAYAAAAESRPPNPVVVESIAERGFTARARAVARGEALRVEGLRIESVDEVMSLERFEVFAPSARIEIHGRFGTELAAPPAAAYFRGRLASDSESSVFLLVDDDVRGIVRSKGRFWLIHPTEGIHSRPAIAATEILEDAKAAERTGGWSCGNESLGEDIEALEGEEEPFLRRLFESSVATATASSGAIYEANLAIETDWEFLQLFAGSTAAATDYVGMLVGAISAIYERDVGTRLQIGYLSLWNVSGPGGDPWNATSATSALGEVGNYWHAERSGVARTTVHFLSGKNVNSGVAWVGVLCAADFPSDIGWGGAYGVTMGIDGNFDSGSSAIVWDILGVSHELGHNFNSPHTHCYNGLPTASDPEVDRCYSSESGCYSGSTSLPPDGGSIMSYCHLLGNLGNVSLSLGQDGQYGERSGRVPQRMRAHVEAVGSRNASCLPIADGGNLLWSSDTGRASLWFLDPAGDLERYVTYGPNRGWSAESYLRLESGGGRLLWTEPARGRASLWNLDASGKLSSYRLYGPHSGWIVTSYDAAPDGTGRLLWSRTSDGHASLWTLDAGGNYVSLRLYGPHRGWTATSYDLVRDGSGRMLWSRASDGLASVWRLDSRGELLSLRLYGPFNGWTATSYQQLDDGTARLLWNRDADGLASLWTLDAQGELRFYRTYGPHPDWSVTSAHR